MVLDIPIPFVEESTAATNAVVQAALAALLIVVFAYLIDLVVEFILRKINDMVKTNAILDIIDENHSTFTFFLISVGFQLPLAILGLHYVFHLLLLALSAYLLGSIIYSVVLLTKASVSKKLSKRRKRKKR